MAASMDANTGGSQANDGGAVPESATTFEGAVGSLVANVMFADFAPADAGWNLIGTSMLSPGATLNGKMSV